MKRFAFLSVLFCLLTLVACAGKADGNSGLVPAVASKNQALVGAAGQARDAGTNGSTTPTCTADASNAAAFAAEVINLVNVERANNGLESFVSNAILTEAAQAHSQDMGCNFFMAHDSYDGTLWSDRILFNFMYDGFTIGENVAAGQSTPATVVGVWMNSPTHRANILNPDFWEIGIGVVYNPNDTVNHYYYYWTMDLGG